MREEAEVAAASERDSIMARAEEDAARISESAERSIRDETERARQSLRREVAILSVDIARERLEKQVNADDQKRLAKDFVDTVKADKGEVSNG
jgi:F-type H+-transporting ATPase subunit b